MRFLFVGSHFCTWASFRHTLAGLPLPLASGYPDDIGSSHRGLSPHKLMPMSGVHMRFDTDPQQRRFAPLLRAGQSRRWAARRQLCSSKGLRVDWTLHPSVREMA
jgi:hypothetical protein